MNIRQIRYFMAVAEYQHFTRAAEAVGVSQPALSQQIRALESELETPLFDRLTTGVELTTAGRVLHSHAERILREVENARVAVEEVTGRVRGELSISAVHTANLAFVVDLVASFRASHPAVSVRIHEERSDSVVDSVLSGRVNLGITYIPVGHGPLEGIPLYEEELVLVVPEGHPLVGESLSADTLADLPLIVPPEGFCLRVGIGEALADRSATPARIIAEISSIEGICAAVRAGLGFTLLPRHHLERVGGVPGLASISIEKTTPWRTVGVIRRTDRHLCLATRAFLESLGAGNFSARSFLTDYRYQARLDLPSELTPDSDY